MKFRQTVVCDFEYEITDGDLPNVLCMVAYVLDENLRHVRTVRLWRGEFGSAPPFDIDDDVCFVAYSAWAEMTCFLQLGWKFPTHIFDLHTAYLAATNILLPHEPDETARKKQKKRLSDACRSYGIPGWENIDKDTMAEDIGNGLWRKYGMPAVFEYCEEDVRNSAELFRRMLAGRALLPASNLELTLHWSDYSAKAVARIQARGMPIDMRLWNLVQENKTAVVRRLLERLDPSHGSDNPIYTDDGEFNYVRFAGWLAANGITAWPRLESGQLKIKGDAFKLMYAVHPGIEPLHALRDSLGVIVRAKLPIGRDGRNRPKIFPFCTSTGRNAHAQSLYNAHAGVRSFMKFDSDVIGVYLDWRTQEVGIAAALSGDQALMEDYTAGDVYHALARMCGLTKDPDPIRWKKLNQAQRDRMKPLQLGINYGMGVPSLAKGLDRHPYIASDIIERHKRMYPQFWAWRDNAVQQALLDRKIESVFCWPLRISYSPNKRSLYNFPMQGNGAEMLRLATVDMCAASVIPNMLVHDAVLLEAKSAHEVKTAVTAMLRAGRQVCDGFEIGVGIDQHLVHGTRYRDKRPVAKKMWATILEALCEVGAISREEYHVETRPIQDQAQGQTGSCAQDEEGGICQGSLGLVQ